MPTHAVEDGQAFALVLCDITGYTQFIFHQHEARAHGFVVVGQLLKSIVRSVQPALRFAKFEGDAVFLYRPLPEDPERRKAALRETLAACDRAFHAFTERRRELTEANLCPCEACVGAGHLDLKILLSAGPTVLHRIGTQQELGGVEVIRLHRLAKNSVELRRYLLITESTGALLEDAELPAYLTACEEDPDLGQCHVRVYEPPLGFAPPESARRYNSVLFKAKDILTKIALGRAFQFGLVPPRPG